MYKTTEITSDKISSDNPIHQRLLKPYVLVAKEAQGKVLELGCGFGRGVELLLDQCEHYTAIDKNKALIESLSKEYPQYSFIHQSIPPFKGIEDESYDLVINFQVIEHIQNDELFVKEIHRVLKKGGRAIFTTPNRKQSLSRNPWHVREYFSGELIALLKGYFPEVEAKGILANEKVQAYIEENKASVDKIMRWDVLNLQHRLPRWALQIPYEILNRVNRNKLQDQVSDLVKSIHHQDYVVGDDLDNCLDFYFIARK